MNKMRLFCLPYAGSNRSLFFSWENYLSSRVDVIQLNLPGRLELISDPLCTNMEDLLTVLFSQIEVYLKEPFAIFGHSMGGLVTYALASKIEAITDYKPKFVIISAMYPPDYIYTTKIHLFDDKKIISKLKDNNIMSQEIFESKELMELILPIYRADCQVIECYEIAEDWIPLKCDIYLFYSENDISKKIISGWNKYFDKKIYYIEFQSGHFFIHKETFFFFKELNNIIKQY